MNVFDILLPIGLGAVSLVLFAGLLNMMRGGSSNLSQKLMRGRVILQFITLVIILAILYFYGV
ncbi:MAG: twin transmembrane helix small protein [Alphaproteobacteria bacterium]|nr:twin transmembrane helix small protein [Alphaproteobacteria bacterium]